MQRKFCWVCYDTATCRLSTGFLLGNTEGARAQGQEMGDVLAPPAQPARENPQGKRQSHIVAAVPNPRQIVHPTTPLCLLAQLPPIWKPCRTQRQEVSPRQLGNMYLIKFPPMLTQPGP